LKTNNQYITRPRSANIRRRFTPIYVRTENINMNQHRYNDFVDN